MKYYIRLLGYLKPYVWPYFILGMVCMLAFGATDGAIPFLVQHIMDDVFARKDQTVLSYLPLVVIGIFAFRGFMNFGQSYLNDYVGLRIINDARNQLNRHFRFLSEIRPAHNSRGSTAMSSSCATRSPTRSHPS